MLQEFLFFLLPLINFRKIKNFVVRNLLRKSAAEIGASKPRSDDAYKECVVCAEWPTHPHGIVNCPHVFCYFCLQVVCTVFTTLSHWHHLTCKTCVCPSRLFLLIQLFALHCVVTSSSHVRDDILEIKHSASMVLLQITTEYPISDYIIYLQEPTWDTFVSVIALSLAT